MPLAGTSYFFAREIAMWERYDVRVYVAGWDSKWVRTSDFVFQGIPSFFHHGVF